MATRYSKQASRKVAEVMRERKKGTLRSGSSKKKVTSRKQAIAIGLAEARRAGAKVPKKKTAKKQATGKRSSARTTSAKRKTATRKSPARKKTAARKTATRKKTAARKKAGSKKKTARRTSRSS